MQVKEAYLHVLTSCLLTVQSLVQENDNLSQKLNFCIINVYLYSGRLIQIVKTKNLDYTCAKPKIYVYVSPPCKDVFASLLLRVILYNIL